MKTHLGFNKFFLICVIFFSAVEALSCPLVGDYLVINAASGAVKQTPAPISIVSAGSSSRELLQGSQALSDSDCKVIPKQPYAGFYWIPFDLEQYRGLGWSAEHSTGFLSCFGNDLSFVCRKPKAMTLRFTCPSENLRLKLSYEGGLLCMVAGTSEDSYLKPRHLEFVKDQEYVGVGNGLGFFYLKELR